MGGQVIICSGPKDYESHQKSSEKSLVFFTAPWSGPAQKLSATVKDLAEEYPNVKILQLDMRHFQPVVKDLKVVSAPTFVFQKNGKEVSRLYVAKPSELYEHIKKLQ